MRVYKHRLRVGVLVASLTILSPALINAQSGARWPQYGFDARHTLFDRLEHVIDPSNVAALSLQWEFSSGNGTGIAPFSGPALADGVVYVGSYAETTFRALDAATGAIRWTYSGSSFFSDPAVGGGHVYTASLDGNLYSFPTSCVGTCSPEWTTPVGTLGTNSPPTLSNGRIYIGGYDGRVYAFEAAGGTQLWSAQVNPQNVADPLNFAPAVSQGRVFVSGDRGIYAFREPVAPRARLFGFRKRRSLRQQRRRLRG
jgi:outer membrane protein assembly factor BamB